MSENDRNPNLGPENAGPRRRRPNVAPEERDTAADHANRSSEGTGERRRRRRPADAEGAPRRRRPSPEEGERQDERVTQGERRRRRLTPEEAERRRAEGARRRPRPEGAPADEDRPRRRRPDDDQEGERPRRRRRPREDEEGRTRPEGESRPRRRRPEAIGDVEGAAGDLKSRPSEDEPRPRRRRPEDAERRRRRRPEDAEGADRTTGERRRRPRRPDDERGTAEGRPRRRRRPPEGERSSRPDERRLDETRPERTAEVLDAIIEEYVEDTETPADARSAGVADDMGRGVSAEVPIQPDFADERSEGPLEAPAEGAVTHPAGEYQEEAWQHSDHVGDEPGPLDEGRGSEAPETEAAPVRDQTPLEPFAGEERRPEPFSPERDVLFADLTTFSVEAHGPAMREADPRVAVPTPESVPAIDVLPPREPVVEPSAVPTPKVGPVMEVELHEMPVPSPDAVPDVTVAAEVPLEPESASIVRLEQKIQATGRTVEREPRGRIPFIREDYVEVDVTRLPHIDPETREEIRPKRDTGLPPADIEDSSEWIDYDDEDYDNEDFLGEKPRKRGGAGTAEEERDERAWDPVLFRQKVAARAAALRRPHKVSVFWVCYAIMVAALVSFALFAFFHTYDSLVRYEVSQPQAFIGSIVDDLMAGGKDAEKARKECLVDKDLAAYDSADLINARFDAGIGRQDLTYAVDGMTDVNAPTYTIYAGEVPYLTLKLNAKKSYVRLGLLSITDWEIVDSLVYDGVNTQSSPDSVVDGLSYEISVADNSHVFVNGNELTQADLSDEATVLAGFEYAARFVDPPEAVTYKVSGFRTEPTIEVKTYEGKDVELTRSGNSFAATSLSVPNRSAEQLPVDVLSWMESWSKLMTQDLGGPGNSYGVDQVNAFLIPGSELYDFINTFVNSVDITFVNGHSLDSFTEESVTNCVMYNENLFSCDIHFVKNMTISGTGMYKGDVFDNNCIFAYVDDPNIVYAPGWYLVNMQANSRSD